MPEGFTEVTRDAFFARINGPEDIMPTIMTSWPYTCDWVTRQRQIIGRTVDYIPEGRATTETRYYLKNKETE